MEAALNRLLVPRSQISEHHIGCDGATYCLARAGGSCTVFPTIKRVWNWLPQLGLCALLAPVSALQAPTTPNTSLRSSASASAKVLTSIPRSTVVNGLLVREIHV